MRYTQTLSVIKVKIDHEAATLGADKVGQKDGPKTVTEYIRQAFGVQRHAYNWGLNRWHELYEAYISSEKTGVKPNAMAIKKEYTALKKELFPWTYYVTKCAVQAGFDNLETAFKNWFSSLAGARKGPRIQAPKFKKKGDRDSFKLLSDHCHFQVQQEFIEKWRSPKPKNQRRPDSQPLCGPSQMVLKTKAYLKLPNFGYVRLRELPPQLTPSEVAKWRILSAVFSEEADGFYVSLSFVPKDEKACSASKKCEDGVGAPAPAPTPGRGSQVGIDAGLRTTIQLSRPIPLDYLKQHGIQDEWIDASTESVVWLKNADGTQTQAVKKLLIPKVLQKSQRELRRLDKSIARKKNTANPLVNLTKAEAKLLLLWQNILLFKEFGLTTRLETLAQLNALVEATKKADVFAKWVALLRTTPHSHALTVALQQRKMLYLHVRRVREDFVHKVSNALVRYFSFIGTETLNLKGMANKGFGLGKSVASACIGKLFQCLGYKCDRTGTMIQKIDQWFPSSKKCSTPGCSYLNKDLKLKDKTWVCPECGVRHDRDENSAINIEVEALRLRLLL